MRAMSMRRRRRRRKRRRKRRRRRGKKSYHSLASLLLFSLLFFFSESLIIVSSSLPLPLPPRSLPANKSSFSPPSYHPTNQPTNATSILYIVKEERRKLGKNWRRRRSIISIYPLFVQANFTSKATFCKVIFNTSNFRGSLRVGEEKRGGKKEREEQRRDTSCAGRTLQTSDTSRHLFPHPTPPLYCHHLLSSPTSLIFKGGKKTWAT